jgi:hypothetical protein
MVHATVYRDLNDNGLHDAGEPFEKGALITTGTLQAEKRTDSNGSPASCRPLSLRSR